MLNNSYNPNKCQPVKLSKAKKPDWNEQNRLEQDPCHVTKREQESVYPGFYQITGFDSSRQNCAEYAELMSTLLNHQKTYNINRDYVDAHSELIQPPLTNLRIIHQLSTRPYKGNYMGPGRHSVCPDTTDVESFLWQGHATGQFKPSEVTSGKDITGYAMNYLPCFGTPQRVEHVVEPAVEIGGWIRGGQHTRDLVRQVNYRKFCLNRENNKIIRRQINSGK